jgi:hypothetical protein
MKNIIFTVILLFFVTSCNNSKNKLTHNSKVKIEFEEHFSKNLVGKEITIPQNFELVEPQNTFEEITKQPVKSVFQISNKETLLIEEIKNIK